jgi:cell wall assembly regulator SMI1
VHDSWTAITGWLASNCPEDFAAIGPPASLDAVTAAEQELQRPLPEDLKAWWTLADGVRSGHHISLIPHLNEPLSVRSALAYRRAFLVGYNDGYQARDPEAYIREFTLGSTAPAGTIPSRTTMWIPPWLPIAANTSDIFVDLRAGPEYGCVGPFTRLSRNSNIGEPMWGSVGEMLQQIADALLYGREVRGWRPELDDGRLTWNRDFARDEAFYVS